MLANFESEAYCETALITCLAVASVRALGRHSAYKKCRIVPRTSSERPKNGGGSDCHGISSPSNRIIEECTLNCDKQNNEAEKQLKCLVPLYDLWRLT